MNKLIIKQKMKSFVRKIVQNDSLWNFLRGTLVRASNCAVHQRRLFDKEELTRIEEAPFIVALKQEKIVHNGPFKGMKYPSLDSVCSTILPKLIGSYELEIQAVIEDICKKDYTQIIDIGCAEGYYAVGLALRIQQAKVYAFDIDEKAKDLCRQMAQLNGVGDRVIIGGLCTKEVLLDFNFSEKTLIICDCEGYEIELFDFETVQKFKNCDLLIELHDFIDITISEQIKRGVSDTHDFKIFESIDDVRKVRLYQYPETKELALADRRIIFTERRPAIMEWLFAIPKFHNREEGKGV